MNTTRSTTLSGTAASREDLRAPRAVAIWLLICCALVFAIVVVGGATRLTHSGLSITEWQPIVGTLPPLSAAQGTGLRQIPGTARIPASEQGNESRRIQVDILVGIRASAAWARRRCGVCCRSPSSVVWRKLP
jgi:hypothetical protein